MSFSIIWKRGWDLGGLLQAINAEDNYHQVAGSLVKNETTFLEFSLKYDGAL